ERQRLAVHLVAGAGVELAIARQRNRVGARLLERLADVVGLELGEQLDVVEYFPADRGEDAAALDGAEAPPAARSAIVERSARRADRGIDISGPPAADACELAAVRRVLERNRRARRGGAPFAADEQAIGGEADREGRGSHGMRSGPRLRLCAIIRTSPCARAEPTPS